MEGQITRWTLRMLEQGALWFTGAFLVLRTPLWPLGITIVGVVYARNLEFMHECLHATALPRPRDNALFGCLLGLPMLVSFERWRREHMRHHADVRVEGFRYEYARLTSWREYIIHSLMLRHFADGAMRLVRLDREYRSIAAAIVLVACAALAFHSMIPALLWVAPLPVAAIVHTHIELPEHIGLGGSDPLQNSRIIPASKLLTWFVNANNYHAIHHWKPRLPVSQLREAYAAITPAVNVTTYAAFYGAFYRNLRSHKPLRENAG